MCTTANKAVSGAPRGATPGRVTTGWWWCHACKITNACDTDWLDCNVPMEAAGLDVEHLLEDWMRARWLVKHGTGRK